MQIPAEATPGKGGHYLTSILPVYVTDLIWVVKHGCFLGSTPIDTPLAA